ncbi:pirin family protein [Ramlibacter rhizophilus]|uniref:Pirin family protein n=1 Tax=Ramlibacter rhizophilus TaxID=1781167 RepID=A0A4Z0BVG2_9BURK|nr:pirin family protein [Ramlibacter rhizophilus]TFZ03283.1 pirin family protein [Ramlibacter rhizophilus]
MAAAQLIAGSEKDLGGGFKVRRYLPAPRRRTVGPFIFFDHFGPVTEVPEANHDVRPHPHIGLATVTYLFEGAMMHRDSLGSEQLIEPGAINWMTAGAGIAHSERRPASLRQTAFVNHGLQLWVGLPTQREDGPPGFTHTPAADIPEDAVQGARVRVLVGEAFGLRSPVEPASPTLYLDLKLGDGWSIELPPLAPEMAVYAVEGELLLDGQAVPPQQMVVLGGGQEVRLQARGAARVAVVGGEPLDGPRHIWWNFVHSQPARIHEAAQRWEERAFEPIPGESEFIPLPAHRFVAPPAPQGNGADPQYL